MFGSITTDMVLAILPEIALLVLIAVVFVTDLVVDEKRRGILAWTSIIGLLITMLLTAFFAQPGAEAETLWGGMLRHDWLAYVSKLIFLFGALITTVFTLNWDSVRFKGEFYVLLLTSTLGMTLMGASADLIMLFLSIETTSIPLYVLAGFLTDDDRSTEAGFKYLLFGAMTTAVMLYGFSLLYGFAGSTGLYEISAAIGAGQIPAAALAGAAVLVLVGFGFKVAMAPLHFWAPDVYEGAPTPITAFLSTASKAAGFVVLTRVMIAAFSSVQAEWQLMLAIAAVISMTLGNLVALSQTNIKRLLAYSSIAHAGYALLGVIAASELGAASVVYYFLVYVVTNMAAFGVVIVVSRVIGSDEIADYAGLSRRSPGLALVMLLAFLSLAGIPPLGGFIAKVLVFAAAVQAEFVWLAVIGVLNAIIGLYYYLIVLKVVYLTPGKDEQKALPTPRPQAVALVVSIVLLLLMGTVFAPWYQWALNSASALF
ncbi:MAG: NADH-quinone oxidoreductase subunit N [Chloroflexi bacterium]|nr:NADH-quinone oxidoreductase subunit N [Chloroflexota bacterium]